MTFHRRAVIALACSIGLCASAFAQAPYPSRPITIIVPYAPGGNLDIVTRVVGVDMAKTLGQSVVIENKPGAGGLIGHQLVARAPADGYTLVTTANGSFAVSPKLQPKLPFKPDDFIPVGSIAETPQVLEVNAKSRFHTIGELLAFAKSHPGQVTIGHSGNGTTNHLAILLLQEAAHVKFNIVAYKGSAPAITDLLGGQIDAVVDQLPSSLPHLKGGSFRALAATTSARAGELPDVPTLAESGVKGCEMSTTSGLLLPAKTPDAVVKALNKALNTALKDPEVQKRLHDLGSQPRESTPEQFRTFLAQQDSMATALVQEGLLTKN